MSDEQSQDGVGEVTKQPDEREILFARARMLGLTVSNNIGTEKLRERVNAKMNGESEPKDDVPEDKVNPLDPVVPNARMKKMTLSQHLQKDALKLIRLRITNMNPNKKDLQGEILTVANEYIGSIRKFVPYGEATENGYHVPYCLYKMMLNRRYLQIRTRRNRDTQTDVVETNWVREFAIEVLPPLTTKEIAELKTTQAARGDFS